MLNNIRYNMNAFWFISYAKQASGNKAPYNSAQYIVRYITRDDCAKFTSPYAEETETQKGSNFSLDEISIYESRRELNENITLYRFARLN